MPVSNHMKIGFLTIALASVAWFLSACSIKENYVDCPPDPVDPPVTTDVRQLLYLRIADVLTGEDVTNTESLQDVMVYLFDSDEMLVDTVPYTTAMIRSAVPIDLTDRGLEGGYVTVWANLEQSVDYPVAAFGEPLDELEINMLEDEARTEFYRSPGDMFFGYQPITLTRADVTETDTVYLKRKNARLHITVKGLPEGVSEDDYYFHIRLLYSGYDYTGGPLSVSRNMWETGIIEEADFVCGEPYWMIHHPSDLIYTDDNSLRIDLFQVAPTRAGEDILLASALRDESDAYIYLQSGRTTNVLIVIEPRTGDMSVHMEITPWNEIYQWVTW